MLHRSDKCVPMETDLSCHCHRWPVKWNPALPERNQLVTWLISHQYISVTFDNQLAIKLHMSSHCHRQTHAHNSFFWSLCLSASCPFSFLSLWYVSFSSLPMTWALQRLSTSQFDDTGQLKHGCPEGGQSLSVTHYSLRIVKKWLCSYDSKSKESSLWSEASEARLWHRDKSVSLQESPDPSGWKKTSSYKWVAVVATGNIH